MNESCVNVTNIKLCHQQMGPEMLKPTQACAYWDILHVRMQFKNQTGPKHWSSAFGPIYQFTSSDQWKVLYA